MTDREAAIEAMAKAVWESQKTHLPPWNDIIVNPSFTYAVIEYRRNATAAYDAAYPMIRAQVIEDLIVEAKAITAGSNVPYITNAADFAADWLRERIDSNSAAA